MTPPFGPRTTADDVLAGVLAWLVMQGLTWGWAHWLI